MKIILGNLKHRTIGRHSPFVPVNIAYIASYVMSKSLDFDIRIYDDVNKILENIEKWNPDVLGLSNYCWNSELSSFVFKYAKKNNSNVLTVAGGPDFPEEYDECEEYLLGRKEVDFYIYREGEIAFNGLVNHFLINREIQELKNKKIDGTMSIDINSNKLVVGKEVPRIKDLDIIPSPYLTNLLDPWLNEYHAPSIETTRGCPFLCQYCHTGNECYNKIGKFSTKRIKEELEYIACRMKNCSRIPLSICDTNFGIYKRDEEIIRYIKKMQDKYGWPIEFDITTGKAKYDKILDMIKHLGGTMRFDCAVQSMNPNTLNVIKRKNIDLQKFKKLQKKASKYGIISIAEFIIPLPEETKKTFLNGMKNIMSSGVKYTVPYTTMLLKGTGLSSKENRSKYLMETRFRLLPRMFGEYNGEKCFEIEEVCIATNKFSFEDYLDTRGIILVSSLLGSDHVDVVSRILEELSIPIFDFICFVWDIIKNKESKINSIYSKYLKETKDELWKSREEIYKFFSQEKNYNKLLKGEIGDNLIRKYKAIILLKYYKEILSLFYFSIKEIIKDRFTKDVAEFLDDSKKWMFFTREMSDLLKGKISNKEKKLFLSYDINKWYQNKDILFLSCKKSVQYKIYYKNIKQIQDNFYQREKLFGKDYIYSIGKLLIDGNINFLWKDCEIIDNLPKIN